jgi:hypothetical protein
VLLYEEAVVQCIDRAKTVLQSADDLNTSVLIVIAVIALLSATVASVPVCQCCSRLITLTSLSSPALLSPVCFLPPWPACR